MEIEKLPTGHMVAFDASNGRRYVVIAPTGERPYWEVYRSQDGMMPQITGPEAKWALDEYFAKEEA